MSHQEAGERLLQESANLADKITEKQYLRQPDLLERFGENGKMRTKQDSEYSLNYLAESALVTESRSVYQYIPG